MHEQSQFFDGTYNRETKDPEANFFQEKKKIMKLIHKHTTLSIFHW